MNKRRVSKIPRFRNEIEERRFWDTHDSTAFLDELRPVKVTFTRPKPKVLVSVRMGKPELGLLRHLAARRGLACGSLIRMWLTERLRDEVATAKKR